MNIQENTEEEGFHVEFKYQGRKYVADIKYPYPLNEKEKEVYKVEDGEFLVHLFDEVGSRTFKVFIGKEFEHYEYQWVTDSPSLLIEWELVQVIGNLIDSKLA